MKPIDKDELYQNLSEFLKAKGVSLQEGSYSRGIHAGCSFLADAINLSQAGINRAKNEIEKQLDHARQIIHEKTAPKNSRRASPPNAAKGKSSSTGGTRARRRKTGNKRKTK
jgi:hypothetical protein